jgi:hypothetical protein
MDWTLSNCCWWSKAYLITGHLLHNSYTSCISAISIPGTARLDGSLIGHVRLLSIPDVLTDLSTLMLLISDSGETSLQFCHQDTFGCPKRGLHNDKFGSHHCSVEVASLGPVGSCHCGKLLLCSIMCHRVTKHEITFLLEPCFCSRGSRFVHHTISLFV